MKQKKKMTSTGFLLLITIVLFFVMYAAGMVGSGNPDGSIGT